MRISISKVPVERRVARQKKPVAVLLWVMMVPIHWRIAHRFREVANVAYGARTAFAAENGEDREREKRGQKYFCMLAVSHEQIELECLNWRNECAECGMIYSRDIREHAGKVSPSERPQRRWKNFSSHVDADDDDDAAAVRLAVRHSRRARTQHCTVTLWWNDFAVADIHFTVLWTLSSLTIDQLAHNVSMYLCLFLLTHNTKPIRGGWIRTDLSTVSLERCNVLSCLY